MSVVSVTTGPRRGWKSVGTWIGAAIVSIAMICAPLFCAAARAARSLRARSGQTPAGAVLDGRHRSCSHLLGTDQLGRDYLSRLIYDCRISMLIGVTGHHRLCRDRHCDRRAGRLHKRRGRRRCPVRHHHAPLHSRRAGGARSGPWACSAAPAHLLVITLGLLLWDRFAVVARSTTMQVRNLDFVAAAWCAGCSRFRILSREVLPNIASHLVVSSDAGDRTRHPAGSRALVPGPRRAAASAPRRGLMIAEAKDYMFFSPWVIVIPGIALFVLVLGINLLGDGLRDAFGTAQDRYMSALLEIEDLAVSFGRTWRGARHLAHRRTRRDALRRGRIGLRKSVTGACAVMNLLARGARRTARSMRFPGRRPVGPLPMRAWRACAATTWR